MKKILAYILPIVILLISVVLTGILHGIAQKEVDLKEDLYFERISQQVIHAIEERLDIYISAHYGGVGLFNASDYVNADEWRLYVESILEYFPGITGLGYAIEVKYDQLPEVLNEIRANEDSAFDMFPKGVRKNYFIIKYIEPLKTNIRAYGFDMGSEATRRKAMELSRDTGDPTISGKVILVQDKNKTPGFLSYVPVYDKEFKPKTVLERQKLFKGFVYAPYIAQDFFNSIWKAKLKDIKNIVHVEIFEGLKMNEEYLIFKNDLKEHKFHVHKQHVKVLPIYLNGTMWSVKLSTCDLFYNELDHSQPWIILFSGLVLSVLIAILVYILMRVQRRAHDLASDMMKEAKSYQQSLEVSNQELQDIKKELEMKIAIRTGELERNRYNLEQEVKDRTVELNTKMNEMSRMNKMMLGREKRMIELKQEISNLKQRLSE